jgi:AmpD protein
VSYWRGRDKCNDFSIGVELEGSDDTAFTEAQYAQLTVLLAALRLAYPTLTDIAGHADIAPGRKTDPGPHFDWERISFIPHPSTPHPSTPHPSNLSTPIL